MNTEPELRRSLRFIWVEIMLSSMIFSMPIMTVFFKVEIGMSLLQVGISQAVFTTAVLILNVPTGWLADRFSRRLCNISGDLLCAVAFGYYAFADSFSEVIVAEIVIGTGLAFSGGADVALLRTHCLLLKLNYRKLWAQTTTVRSLAEMTAMIIGGVIGAMSPRLAIGLSAVTYGLAAISALFIIEVGERRHSDNHPIKDMQAIVNHALRGDRLLAWTIAALAFGRNSTHPTIWLLTPLLLLADVPVEIIGLSWAANLLAMMCGSILAGRVENVSDVTAIRIAAGIFVLSSLGLVIHIGYTTIWLYAGFGFVRGWLASFAMPLVQRHTPEDMQATVVSVASSCAQLIYIPLVCVIVGLGDIDPQLSIGVMCILFVPALLLCAWKIERYERSF